MAASINRCVCLAALFLHSFLLFVGCIQGSRLLDHNIVYLENSEFNHISPFITHHRHARSFHDRVKRQVVVTTMNLETTLPENVTGLIYRLQSQFSGNTHTFKLDSATSDLFTVSPQGDVNLKQGLRLDYEDDAQHAIQIIINATDINNNTAITRVVLTLTVTDVNDASPDFKNKPYPYLATVGPNTPADHKVYELYAEDPDLNSDITYNIDSGGESRFIIRTETSTIAGGRVIKVGNIYTQGQGRFEENREYPLTCSATDNNANPPQTTFAVVHVLVGFRPPQFYETTFRGTVRENNGIDQTLNNEFKIEAIAFQGNTLSYELRDAGNSTSTYFSIDADGTIKTLRILDYESVPREQRPPVYELNVFATEAMTNLQSSSKLFIEVLDDNDNSPVFDLSRYAATHPEDLAIGRSVLQVRATDDDSGENGALVYSVDHDHFGVYTNMSTTRDGAKQYIGTIYVKQKLDYDRLPGHLYSFTVTATDKGSPAASGTANVRVFMTNVNDEPPEIILDDQKLSVREDANIGEVVTVVQAVDLDRDQVKFYFSQRSITYEIFDIVPTSGLIRVSQRVPADRDEYVLNITAVDDGSCCGGTVQLSSEAYLNVEIVDINTHKPSFPDCSKYSSTTFRENQPPSTQVLVIQAVDQDRGENGRVTFSILRGPSQPQIFFNVDPNTGNLTSDQQFDREIRSSYSITVKGTDQGTPPLDGYCTFTVSIEDVNDNAPVFDQPSYTATISESFEQGRSVVTVRADDADLGLNAEVIYSLVPSNDANFFRIEPEAGIIFLNRSLGQQSEYSFEVKATDKGTPPLDRTVGVRVKVTDQSSQPPTWNRNDYDRNPYSVPETAPIGHIIATFAATSSVDDPDVSFNLINSNGQPVQSVLSFGISSSGNVVNLTVFSSMDFNDKNRYELRLRVSNRGTVVMSSEIHPVVELIDTNNKVPKFLGLDTETGYYPGSIPENAGPGQTVIEIKAFDEDPTSPNNLLFFSIVDKPNVSDKFRIEKIDADTAILTSLASFDREEENQLFLDVLVRDGTNSSRPNTHGPNTAKATVRIRITDMNDNSPYFTQTYNASVREDASIQQSILTVKAEDPDDAAVLSYSITGGNNQNSFGVQPKTGVVFVARQLDYETEQHVYNLIMTVSDGIHTNTTTVTIHVLDANDNSPVFMEDPYVVTDVVEEDDSITATNRRLLVQVTATDADTNRPTNIRYSLLGFGTEPPNKYFEVDAESGRLYLLTSLDRDLPSGRATYQFNVRAQDELDPPPGSDSLDPPKFGYTSVQVQPIDINDNAPQFISQSEGSVMEHSPRGSSVMTVVAIDYDEGLNGTVIYEIVEGPSDGQNMKFSIQQNTGLIQTNTDEDGLDRETTPSYTVKVKASDRGINAMSSEKAITINLDDKNDQIPKFEKSIYQIEMSEALLTGPIGRVKATDDDVGENARLDYSLGNFLDHFSITTDENNNEGSINVFKPVDYENPEQRFFNLTVVVQDPEPTHTAVAYVEVTVTDFNDNPPVFVNSRIEVSKLESVPVGTSLATFAASDADSGMNALFSYSIDRKTDPGRLFSIDQKGNVTIRKMLDRETEDHHTVHILAIDKGDPAQTGTATLLVTVLDVNDNFPIFAKDYRPIVMEDADNIPDLVQIIEAIDLDNPPFGAPFGFAEPVCSDGSTRCGCPERPTCEDFDLDFIRSGDGSARVTTKRVFDREKKKFYEMPIVMWDMRGTGDPRSQTGTNTLTIEIGDINDHKQQPGHQDIFVYDYKGMFGPLEIGMVYAQDPDDWDVVDKTFTFTGPKYMESYFLVNKSSGMITMQKGVPSNKAHTFTVDVYDAHWDWKVESTVTVTIQEISEEAVFSSGAVRLKGVTAEEFVIRPKIDNGDITAYGASKYEKLRTFLARKLQVPDGNVDILSVQNNGEFTDVRYSAHGSPYYPASKMNSIVALNRNQMETDVGVKIEQIPIDECADEKFEGGCYNFLNVTGKPALVNSNGTSFVGVEMFVQATEGCRSDFYPQTDVCSADYCYNGGTCSQDDWGELHCECLPGFKGPRCQGTHHSFDGNSYAMYDPLEQCESSRTSLYFITDKEDGLILYNGPTADRPDGSEDPTDFISLELSGGYPRLRIDHGSGPLILYVDGRDDHGVAKMQKLNDGKWHRIDILRNGREVEMIVDHCDKADIGGNNAVSDDKMCRRTGTTPNDNKFLNVNTLLQLGGRFSRPNYPQGIMPTNFDGCVKHLMHNGKLYDLTVPGGSDPEHPAGENQCTREDVICGENSQGGPACGENGICESTWQPDTTTCVCKPGFFGDKCMEEATTMDLEVDSFIQWRLTNEFFNYVTNSKLKMHVMFRTRDPTGVLWTVSSPTDKVVTLKIENGRLTLTYNLGNGFRTLELYNRMVNNGAWHTAIMERNGREFVLKLDNGEGPNFNFTYGHPGDSGEMQISTSVFAGAQVSFAETLPDLALDLAETCIRDVRMDNEWFPMKTSENGKSKAANVVKIQNVAEGCVRDDCDNANCDPGLICYPLWGTYECRCPEHYEKEGNICVEIDYCKDNKCFEGSTCKRNLDRDINYMCICPPGWAGEFCNQLEAAPLLGGITTGAIVAIIVSIFVLLVLAVAIILLVKCGRRPNPDDKYILEVDPDDDIRENVIDYDEEGAGEEDHDAYDINRLRKPDSESIHKPPLETLPRRDRPLRNAPGESPDVGNFIEDRLGDADDDNDAPPYDSVREFVYEGEGSDAGTLSSLNSSSSVSEQDYDYLNDWGPKFAKLADMYGAGQEPGEEDV